MGLLTRDEKGKLQALLLSLPNITNPNIRQLLLSDIPSEIIQHITLTGIPSIDVRAIVVTLEEDWAKLADGSWPISTVIENATGLVRNQPLAGELQVVLD